MALPPRLGLLQFLRKAVQSHKTPTAVSPIYVLGNPSADLDSIISAIVYAYFSTRDCGERESYRRQYIPFINLPDVPSGKELRRLRPEYATALRLATQSTVGDNGQNYVEMESSTLKDCSFTIADWKGWPQTTLTKPRPSGFDPRLNPFHVMMVDWNALPSISDGHGIEGISNVNKDIAIRVEGCVDHHVDESFVPQSSSLPPWDTRVIQTGVGSCTSLIVRDLRSRGLWTDHPAPQADVDRPSEDRNIPEEELASIYESQVAKLALAAILIDTANMTAKDKVSDVDNAAVDFLESKIQQGTQAQKAHGQDGRWDRDQFYEEILHAKQTSLDNLTVQEALGRDFKEWTETKLHDNQNKDVKLGICSVFRPMSWLVAKAADSTDAMPRQTDGTHRTEPLFEELQKFAADRGLDVVAIMTAFSSSNPEKPFQRELLVWALDEKCVDGMRRFEGEATAQLGLESWTKVESNPAKGPETVYETPRNGWRRVWNQTVVSQSRKQVAPLLRNAITSENLEI